jgi:hypothetical protein
MRRERRYGKMLLVRLLIRLLLRCCAAAGTFGTVGTVGRLAHCLKPQAAPGA